MKHKTKRFLGTRQKNSDGSLGKFNYKTYEECIQLALNYGAGLKALDCCPKVNEFRDYKLRFISIFAPNIEPWYIMDIAHILYGYTSAPLYNTLGPSSIAYVLNQTNVLTLGLVRKHLDTILKLK